MNPLQTPHSGIKGAHVDQNPHPGGVFVLEVEVDDAKPHRHLGSMGLLVVGLAGWFRLVSPKPCARVVWEPNRFGGDGSLQLVWSEAWEVVSHPPQETGVRFPSLGGLEVRPEHLTIPSHVSNQNV